MNSYIKDIIDWEMWLLKAVTFLMFNFLCSSCFWSHLLFFPRTCPGRWGALQSWTCLQGWSCSLLWMLKSEPSRLFRMSWTKSKLPVSLQSGKTELFSCKFTSIPPRKCHQIIVLSALSVEIWSPRWEKNPTSLFIVWTAEHLLGKSWDPEDFQREHILF